jgi:dihydroneopterin aldolase
MAQPDQIIVSQLALSTRIGATAEERREPQLLRVSLVLEPRRGFGDLEDTLENTVDYFHLTQAVKALAATGERLLIETLAEEIAALLLAKYPLTATEVELRKFILPDTEFVAVKIRREASQS